MPRIVLNLTDDSRRRVFTNSDLTRLAALGELVPCDPKNPAGPVTFAETIAGADAMLTCWGSRRVDEDDLPAPGHAQMLIAHAAGSVRGIVAKEVLARGDVRLTQGAAAVAVAVSQYTVGLIIMALRQVFWRGPVTGVFSRDKQKAQPYRDLTGLTVGLVGLSQVGRRVPPLLAPFDCKVIAYDPYCPAGLAAALSVTLAPDLDAMLSACDAVSLHAPVTPETQGLIDARRVGLLKPGCAFINTARAQLVDQEALFARAEAGEIECYVDVTAPEPLPLGHKAWTCPHIFITPHIAGPTQQTLRRMAVYAIDEIERHLNGQPLQHEVTFERYDLLA